LSLLARSINSRGPLWKAQLAREEASRRAAIAAAVRAEFPVEVPAPPPAVEPPDAATIGAVEFPRAHRAALSTVRDLETRSKVRAIQLACCAYYGVELNDLMSTRRHGRLPLARHVAQYLCRIRLATTFVRLAELFGGRDWTRIIHGVQRIDRLIIAGDAAIICDLTAIEFALSREESHAR